MILNEGIHDPLMDGVMPNLKAALAAVVRGAMAVGLVEKEAALMSCSAMRWGWRVGGVEETICRGAAGYDGGAGKGSAT